VLGCDKAKMNAWLCNVANIRKNEANVMICALQEKIGKILAL